MAKMNEWMEEVEFGTYGVYGVLDHIRQRAWEYFREKIARNFIFNLLGLTGRIRNIFTEIFGEEI